MSKLAKIIIVVLFFVNVSGVVFLAFNRTSTGAAATPVVSLSNLPPETDAYLKMILHTDTTRNELAKSRRAVNIGNMILMTNVFGLLFLLSMSRSEKTRPNAAP